MVLCAYSILLHLRYSQNFHRSLLGANNTVRSFELKSANSKMPCLLACSKFYHDFVIKESPITHNINWPYNSLKSFLLLGQKHSLLMTVMYYLSAVLIVVGLFYLLRVEHFLLSPEVRLLWNVTFINMCPFSHQNMYSFDVCQASRWKKQRTSLAQATKGSGMCNIARKSVQCM